MITIHVECSYHQKRDGGDGREEEIGVLTIDDQTRKQIEKHLRARGWVVQFNGNNMDTYCSKKCAE